MCPVRAKVSWLSARHDAFAFMGLFCYCQAYPFTYCQAYPFTYCQ